MFAKKGFYEGFPDTHRSYLRNPLVDLPIKPETIFDARRDNFGIFLR
jgi:hypothetical protein